MPHSMELHVGVHVDLDMDVHVDVDMGIRRTMCTRAGQHMELHVHLHVDTWNCHMRMNT